MSLQQKSMLFAAIRSNDILTIEAVLSTKKCSRLLKANGLGFNLLRKSIEYNRMDITNLLLDRGCTASLSSFTGDTPLHLVVHRRGNCYSLVKRLLACGANVDQRNRLNETAIHTAFDSGADDKVLQLMLNAHLRKSAANETNDAGLSYLHIACATANLDCVRQFVEGGADVNAQAKVDSNSLCAGSTPLHMAVEFGTFEVITYLLQQGADVYIPDQDGNSAIHLALELGETDIVELLFDYDNERLNCKNNFGLSHFMAACACSSPTVAQEFLADKFKGGQFLNANEVVKGGMNSKEAVYPFECFTPLHFAAIFGRFDTANSLLADGADCCALSHSELTPVESAAQNGYEEVAELIKAHCQGYNWFSDS